MEIENIKELEEDNYLKNNSRQNQADKLVDIVLDNAILFRNQADEPFIDFKTDDHFEYWPLRSKRVKNWLAKQFWDEYNKSPSGDAINNALNVLEGHSFSKEKCELENRVHFKDGVLWYDLANDKWQTVKINHEDWEVSHYQPRLFRRFSHQRAQIIPERGGDIRKIFDFINIKNEDHKILLLVWLVSCFIPGFPHPIMYFFGPQGSAKSTTSKLLRKIIDPSIIEVSELPKDQNELIQKLSHHWTLIFDNVSFISPELSDLLCRAVSGSGFSKRQLYSDDDDVIYNFKRCLGVNGINLISLKPDLMERSILVELERIPKENRTQEQDLYIKFENELPKILGNIFDIISKAMRIKSSIKIDSYPRMADFALWGAAITEAMGLSKDAFLMAYQRNIDGQNDEVINENPEASFILALMNDKDEWSGTATELLKEMKEYYKEDENIKFPKKPNALSRKLNELKTNLEEAGIKIEITSGRKRKIIITKTRKDAENTAPIASLSEEEKIKNASDSL